MGTGLQLPRFFLTEVFNGVTKFLTECLKIVLVKRIVFMFVKVSIFLLSMTMVLVSQ